MKDPEKYRKLSLNYQPCNQPFPLSPEQRGRAKKTRRKARKLAQVEKLAKPVQWRPLGQAPKWLQDYATEQKRNATPTELALLGVLAEVLPRHKLHCDFQFPIGKYILDFFIPEVRLCVEVDGAHHFTKEGRLHDQRRRRWLWKHKGIRVVRFPNSRVVGDMNGVVCAILASCGPAYRIHSE